MPHILTDIKRLFFKKSLFLQHFSTGAYANITYCAIWLLNMSTYACYDDAKEWGIEKKNILNKALSLNACYQNPVINLNERKNLVS